MLETLIFHKQRQTVLKNTFKEYYQSDYVCTKNDGKRFRPEKLSYHFSKLLKKYNLPHIRLHDLRHTFISILYENGVAAKRLAQMAGHADPAFTERRYVTLNKCSNQDVANLYNEILVKGKK